MGFIENLISSEAINSLYNKFTNFSTPTQILIVLFSIITISTVFNVIQQIFFADPNKPPVIFHIFPFIGSTITYGIEPYKFFRKCQSKYGDCFTFILLGRKMTVYLGPKGNDFILNAKLSDVSAEDAYSYLTTPVFGKGVIYDCPNSRLMEQKKFAKQALTVSSFRKYVPIIIDEVNQFLKSSPDFFANNPSKKSGEASLMVAIPQLTIFTASHCLQGQEVRNEFDNSFAQLYNDLDHGFTPVNFIFPHFPIPANKRRDNAQKTVSDTYLRVINRRRKNSDVKDRDLIDAMLKSSTYKDGVSMTDREIANLQIGILMGGQHTSSATFTWILLHLAAEPKYIEELYQEQVKLFGPNPQNTQISYDNLQELPLHNYVIRETLRLHPPLHSIMRKVKNPLIANGVKGAPAGKGNYVIPRGHYVLSSPGVSMTDEEYFPQSKSFLPWRWDTRKDEENDEKVDFGYGLVSKGAGSPYLPFGAGRHRCIGEQFAYLQLGTLLACFVRKFKWTLPEGQLSILPPDYSSMVTLPSKPAKIVWIARE